ncbi:WXG100 family type VII secretion target [Carnobacteriaceae bacterium zg-ZUI78]|nr:WXG100 family type VII secretion target [Carnobacteriaceae bacterium zg-ZUI78]
MQQISLKPQELKEQARIYVQAKEEIEQSIQRVNHMNISISQEWKGQAFQAYLEQYQQLYQYVQKFEQLLEDIFQQLNRYATLVEQRDREDAQSFGI